MIDNISNPFLAIVERLSAIESRLTDLQALAPSHPAEKKFYSIAEAAQKLNVAEITIYRNAQAGKIPTKKIGSRVMIPGSFVDR